MVSKKYLLIFPPEAVEQPVTYHLISDYNLTINILKASVSPGKKGRLTLEIKGEEKDLRRAMAYLSSINVDIRPVVENVHWREDKCVHCTACVPGCPGQCFVVDRKTMRVSFFQEKCVGCRHCLSVCAYGAIEIAEENNAS